MGHLEVDIPHILCVNMDIPWKPLHSESGVIYRCIMCHNLSLNLSKCYLLAFGTYRFAAF